MLLKAYMKGLTMLKGSAETSCLGKEEETLVSFKLHVVRLRRLATTIGNAGRKGIEVDIQQSVVGPILPSNLRQVRGRRLRSIMDSLSSLISYVSIAIPFMTTMDT